jgi:hypothetical protein
MSWRARMPSSRNQFVMVGQNCRPEKFRSNIFTDERDNRLNGRGGGNQWYHRRAVTHCRLSSLYCNGTLMPETREKCGGKYTIHDSLHDSLHGVPDNFVKKYHMSYVHSVTSSRLDL